jgi:hypothetical protein
VNPLEIQTQLPSLLKELRKAGVNEWQLQQIESSIGSTISIIPLLTTQEW